jgi:G patch domain-containing protein 1
MSNSRPVYVPAHKRKRFHGAFTGGFSAGYFNTVGSKDGWKPREDVRQEQSTQDFMDDQDHNEWGGPTSVNREFVAQEVVQKKQASTPFDFIKPPPNVGTRLLRVLGWREGSAAYVPTKDGETKTRDDSLQGKLLSQKRLRRIQLQETRVRIPPPKLDAGGLGFDVYRDAPEFQAHREKRQREAQDRARAATTEGANAYRLSDLREDDEPTGKTTRQAPNVDTDDPYLSYETAQDFIGTKTVGGFAMREDADDVYDENALAKGSSLLQVDKEQYDSVIYEHESDDEEPDQKQQSVRGILSSWAAGDSSKGAGIDQGVTSDGRPPLPGFCLGGVTTIVESKRYAGPELPPNYVLKHHQFREDEHPSKLAQIAKQEKVELNRQHAFERLTNPMAGAAFTGLAAAMKSRFTAAAPATTEITELAPVGLHKPVSVATSYNGSSLDGTTESAKEIKIVRQFLTFYPDPLVCKRLGVTPPAHSKNRTLDQKQTAEATFFEKEVLKQAAEAKPQTSQAKIEKELILNDQIAAGPKDTDQRPAMEVYKSIYEPTSESEPDDDDKDGVGQTEAVASVEKSKTEDKSVEATSSSIILHASPKATLAALESDSESESDRHRKKRKRRKREDKKRRRKRSTSVSSSDTDLDAPSVDSEDRRRRRKDKKRRRRKGEKKRKKHKSSRRQEDSRKEDILL